MAKKTDLSKMSLDELKQLKKDVDAAIKGYSERQRAEAMKAIEAVAKEHGMSIDEIIGGKGRKRKAKAPAKFANPGNPNETWSGRGRQPGWYKDAVSTGKAPESMAI